jgi:hypothetical protein
MSCRRTRRELLWLVRFGPFDSGSAPHLDHLAGCQDCRDEIGLDRALVRQLRTALAERIGDATPSPSAWEGVLARMRQPEPAQRPWTTRLAALLRAGSAMAGASLALIVALNLDVAPIGATPSPQASDLEAVTAGVPVRAGAGIRHWDGRAPASGSGIDRQDRTSVFWMPTPAEQLPLGRTTLAAVPDEVDELPVTGQSDDAEPAELPVAIRFVPSDAAAFAGPGAGADDEAAAPKPAAPAVAPAGGPS